MSERDLRQPGRAVDVPALQGRQADGGNLAGYDREERAQPFRDAVDEREGRVGRREELMVVTDRHYFGSTLTHVRHGGGHAGQRTA